ncbi:uncharacterized protein LACBIDRAFT_335193 [Laccaria bicolor S238N-H82]|uniref:Predicted protein n=1 Tax=Laccaria bicolor (strain S238N-H82 / ATCC MYA-4686) TaxID=486041 RepID=B0E1N0_LACBS|nr:uncharacterized protein LACBIDRAFT_335193 [Laccaria bicolor S238N-H82]EDQ99268.1 predicted protein [Laccaria bicolor S238N-H82]|eukprot:XP_001890078.1 predicted protein [Laccaria bicolor S238N-H82]
MNEKKKCHFFLLVIRSHYTLEHMSFSIATSSISSGTATTSRLQRDCTALMYDSMTTDELKEALRDAHREINDAQRIISELKLELATAKVKKGGQKVGASEELLSADQEIAKLTRIYMLFHQPWVRADDFRNPKPSFESNSTERFSSDDNLKLGATMELYDCVPERLHDYMQSHSDFATKFMKELSSSRSSIIDRLCKNAATIFGLTPDIFLRKFNRSTNSTINTLLGYNASGKTVTTRYPRLPPFFFENSDASDTTLLFRSEYLLKVALLIIYGPSAIFGDALPILRSNSPYASRSESGTTAGLICCVATLAHFIMSTDTELTGTGVGNVTGIGYFADFDAYKKILTLSRESSIQPPARRTSGNRIHPAPVAPPPVSSPSITSILNTGATAFDSQGTDSENLEAVQGPGDNLTEPVKPLPRRAANRRQVAAAAPSSINSTEPVIPIAAEQPQKRTTRGKKGTTKRR